MRRKRSKSELDLPSRNLFESELRSNVKIKSNTELRSNARLSSIFDLKSPHVCGECIGERVTLYPVCKHVLNEGSYDYVRVHRRSIDSNASSPCEYNYGANSPYNIYNTGLNSPYETDDLLATNNSEQEIEKLWKKINKVKASILKLQELQDENVTVYLKTVNSQTKTINNSKTKSNFERNNRRTNVTIQGLQKKLEKYDEQLKFIEEKRNCEYRVIGSGSKKIIKVVHEQMRSRASSIQDQVVGHLETFNNFLRKRSLSMDDYIRVTDDISNNDNNNSNNNNNNNNNNKNKNNNVTKRNYNSSHTTSEEDLQRSPLLAVRKSGIALANALHQDRVEKKKDEEFAKMGVRVDALEKEGGDIKEDVYDIKEMLNMTLQSLQEEKYKIEHLQRRLNDIDCQWNDMTELHQNEIEGIRDEIERTFECIERIEYRFSDKNTDLSEHVENCTTRLSRLEKEQQEQFLQPSYHNEARILLSKLLSFLINILLAIIFSFIFLTKILASPFTSNKTLLISSAIIMVAVIVICHYRDNGLFNSWRDWPQFGLSNCLNRTSR